MNAVSRILLPALVLTLTFSPKAQAAGACRPKQEAMAQRLAADLGTWTKLHSFFLRFHPCDDGGLSEDITESVVRLLVDKWNTLPDLQRISQSDPKFEKFVTDHIDSTADTEDLTALVRKAGKTCPVASRAICRKISTAAKESLAE